MLHSCIHYLRCLRSGYVFGHDGCRGSPRFDTVKSFFIVYGSEPHRDLVLHAFLYEYSHVQNMFDYTVPLFKPSLLSKLVKVQYSCQAIGYFLREKFVSMWKQTDGPVVIYSGRLLYRILYSDSLPLAHLWIG